MDNGFHKNAALPWVYKDPESVLDYSLNWSDWLGTDTISAVVWTVPAGITQTTATNTTTAATIWLSGGTANAEYTIECKITTASGRTDERSFIVKIRER